MKFYQVLGKCMLAEEILLRILMNLQVKVLLYLLIKQ